jgi:hypothetical protein
MRPVLGADNLITFYMPAVMKSWGLKLLETSGPVQACNGIAPFLYMSDKMQRYTVYLYLETALHVSGVTSSHHQERIQLYLQRLVFVTPLLLPAAIAAGRSNGVTNTRCRIYSCMCN